MWGSSVYCEQTLVTVTIKFWPMFCLLKKFLSRIIYIGNIHTHLILLVLIKVALWQAEKSAVQFCQQNMGEARNQTPQTQPHTCIDLSKANVRCLIYDILCWEPLMYHQCSSLVKQWQCLKSILLYVLKSHIFTPNAVISTFCITSLFSLLFYIQMVFSFISIMSSSPFLGKK